ncbi:MAG TPA: DeoR/GlpR family DNA-binding transcription regulator [Galbitalea sp.]|jgi:DeoR family transcriptional regulator of aga operon|nr:DeoR/GlpR family DNA-binding transcription regulator [Galbitalea sp.]
MTPELALPAAVRRERIAAIVEEQGFARVTELSDLFGISEVTTRTDLDALAKALVVQRIHGGAIAASHSPTPEKPFEQTSLAAAGQKRGIGIAAAALVQSGQAIVLDVGTTTTAIATALVARTELRDVVVITNALNIAVALESAIPRFTVIVTGGTLRPLQHSLVDPLAGAVLEHVRADIAFVGCSGVDVDAGVTNVNLPEADVKRRMIAAAARSIVVADSTKLGVAHHSRVAPLSDVDGLITSSDADPRVARQLAHAGLPVTLAT